MFTFAGLADTVPRFLRHRRVPPLDGQPGQGSAVSGVTAANAALVRAQCGRHRGQGPHAGQPDLATTAGEPGGPRRPDHDRTVPAGRPRQQHRGQSPHATTANGCHRAATAIGRFPTCQKLKGKNFVRESPLEYSVSITSLIFSPKFRENALQMVLFALMTFPSTYFDVQALISRATVAAVDRKKRVRHVSPTNSKDIQQPSNFSSPTFPGSAGRASGTRPNRLAQAGPGRGVFRRRATPRREPPDSGREGATRPQAASLHRTGRQRRVRAQSALLPDQLGHHVRRGRGLDRSRQRVRLADLDPLPEQLPELPGRQQRLV